MKEKRKRTLWCKKAIIRPASGSLQAQLKKALDDKEFVDDRSEPTSGSEESKSYRLIAQYYSIHGGIAGIFTSYVPGAGAVTVERAPKARQMNVAQLQPPNLHDGKKREWAEGLVYFFCRDNYVVVIQSLAVRIEQFEEHLSWLLKKEGETVGPAVMLADHPAASVGAKVRKSHIKTISLGGSLLHTESEVPEQKTRQAHLKVSGTMLDAVKAALTSEDDSFKWEDALDGNIEAWLHLSYKRSTTESAQRLLDKIGLAFRNVEGIDTVLELNNGEKITARELKLTTTRNIEADDGVLVADRTFQEMIAWLASVVDAKELA